MGEFIISIIILVFGFALGAMTYGNGQSPSIEKEKQLASTELKNERDLFKNGLKDEREYSKKLEIENLQLKAEVILLSKNQMF